MGLGLSAASPFITGLGANMFASGNSLTLCSGGALAPIGAYISLSGMGIGGSYILAKSSKLKDLNSNKDSLSNLKNSGQKKIEFKKTKSHISGKDGSKKKPSWAEGKRPYKNESGKQFAKRLLDERYGENKYQKGAASEFNKIKKWGDRAFE